MAKGKAYTRTGDQGDTSLYGGARVSKESLRVHATGDVDELNAIVGLARARAEDATTRHLLHRTQKFLFTVGADVATPLDAKTPKPLRRVIAEDVDALEKEIDALDAELPELHAFVIPGGNPQAAILHLARAVCRRAERTTVLLAKNEPCNPEVVRYLNRLSSLLFVLARRANAVAGTPEEPWKPPVA